MGIPSTASCYTPRVGTPAEMADAVVMIVAFWVTVGLFCVVERRD